MPKMKVESDSNGALPVAAESEAAEVSTASVAPEAPAAQEESPVNAPVKPADQTDTPPGKVRVRITNNFNLSRDDGSVAEFRTDRTNCGLPGFYDLDPADAHHPYLVAHSADAPPYPPPFGTEAHVRALQAAAYRKGLLEAAQAQDELTTMLERRAENAKRIKAALEGHGSQFTPAR